MIDDVLGHLERHQLMSLWKFHEAGLTNVEVAFPILINVGTVQVDSSPTKIANLSA